MNLLPIPVTFPQDLLSFSLKDGELISKFCKLWALVFTWGLVAPGLFRARKEREPHVVRKSVCTSFAPSAVWCFLAVTSFIPVMP